MSHDAARDVVASTKTLDLNEADTRFHIIDRILRDVLGWPTNSFKMEPSTISGYSDYHLLRPNGKPILIVERSGAVSTSISRPTLTIRSSSAQLKQEPY
jgi:predicted type IV restriction endonuclease